MQMMAFWLIISLTVLNPYTVAGPIAYYVALPICGIAILRGFKSIRKDVLLAFALCVMISCIGVFSSLLHGITQVGHLKVAVSIFVYYLLGIGLYFSFLKKGFGLDDALLAALWMGVANGVVILLQVQVPAFRTIVESFLGASGNIDWKEGFRYRGVAAGGGASLSILIPVCVFIAMYLYGVKRIGIFATTFSIAVLIASVFFIGRTGLILLPFVVLFYALGRGRRVFNAVLLWGGIFGLVIIFGFGFMKEFLIEQYGEGFYMRSLGYFLEGSEGFQDEGTASVLIDYLNVLPKEFPEVFVGYGFYGGSDFWPWTDSGYARMFLSVGYIFGLLFYVCVLYIFRVSIVSRSALFVPLIAILLMAEVKEGLLLAGYSSRLVFILLGFWAAERSNSRRSIRQSIPLDFDNGALAMRRFR